MKSPKKIIPWLHSQFTSRFGVPRLMSYAQSFNAVMNGADILSSFLINHVNLSKLAGVLSGSESVQSHYQAWSGYQASANIFIHYYYTNILRNFVAQDEVRTVMEIGSGNGNFASILHHDWAPIRVILVDLPETLAVAIPFLSNLFPTARLLMPHEVSQHGLNSEFDFAFLTVDQVDIIQENSVDLAINCHSFQEMTHDQIDSYFCLVQKLIKPAGLFFVANRIEKIPCGDDALTADQMDPPNRFAEYPWDPRNHDLVYEISKLSRLVSLDPVAIRLLRISK
jgi:putative sugar O-methyltransferase